MLTKNVAVRLAAGVKRSLDELHTQIDSVSTPDEKARLQAAVDDLHARLNGIAQVLSNFFGEGDVSTFSGGTGKPAIVEDAPDADPEV